MDQTADGSPELASPEPKPSGLQMRLLGERNALIFGVVFVILAVLNAPLHLYLALSSDVTLHESTMGEVMVLRMALGALGVGAILGVVVWRMAGNSGWQGSLRADYGAFVAGGARLVPVETKFIFLWSAVLLAVIGGLVWTIFLSIEVGGVRGGNLYDLLSRENGIWESLTAINLLVGGVLLIFYGMRMKGILARKLAALCPCALGLLFVVAAGEEVSWGQHWFQFATPEALEEINVQGEFNLHNIGGYWANQVMMLFFLGYVGILPIVAYLFEDVRYLVDRLCIPLVPLAFAPYGFVGVLMGEQDILSRLWGSPPWRLSEAREMLFSAVILGVAIHVFLQCRRLQKGGRGR